MSDRQLGPVQGATLITSNLASVSQAYQRTLGYTLVRTGTISDQHAAAWNTPRLRGSAFHILASSNQHAWLRIVEDVDASPIVPLKQHGWMSLEVNVKDVDGLRPRFDQNNDFSVIGEPAYLQVSDAIKAMQVIGPAGEVNYLTQVERPVPPFELPMSETETGSLFIPVLCCRDRARSVAFYEQLNSADKALQFDTKITVLNGAWQRDIEHQYPVATLQLDGLCLFEIDQVPEAAPICDNTQGLPSGIAMISCFTSNLDEIAARTGQSVNQIEDAYYEGSDVLLLQGPDGELLELIGKTQ